MSKIPQKVPGNFLELQKCTKKGPKKNPHNYKIKVQYVFRNEKKTQDVEKVQETIKNV